MRGPRARNDEQGHKKCFHVSTLKPSPQSAAENLFAAVNVPQYVLDLRSAPANVFSWLHQVRDHWNGASMSHFATADAFDMAYYVSPVNSACMPE
jgi:hypothetical protein